MIPVVAAVVEVGGRYLVCQRPSQKAHGGLWEFPGGKRLPGETDADALARELMEELGVVVESVGPLLAEVTDRDVGVAVRFFGTKVTGEPTLREHLDMAWASPTDLCSLNLAPSDAFFVKAILEPGSDGRGSYE